MVGGLECVPTGELKAFLLGELPERVARRVTAHLEECPACEAEAGRLDVETDPLIRSLRRILRPEADNPTGTSAGTFPPAARDSDRVPPAQVGGYEILGELGRGGMGVVYKARQPGLNRLVALKMILAAEHAGAERRTRFQAEAEAVARLSHPNIVQVHEVGAHRGLPYVCLEFIDGPNLGQWLGGAPQPPRQAAALVEMLARAVQHAHEASVVHRDLKPANILLSAACGLAEQSAKPQAARAALADWVPKIADFGLAKQTGPDLTATGVILGTPSYMAPEQAAGEKGTVGPLADVYALGAILYEMLTGRPPFKAGSALETLEQVRTQEPVPPRRLVPKCPRDLETVCLKCLRKEPHKRYRSADALADDLARFLAGRPVQARPVGVTGRAWRWCRRNPFLAGAAILMTLVLAAAAIISTVSAIHAEERRRQAEVASQVAREEKEQAERRLTENHLDRGLELCEAENDPGRGLLQLSRALETAPAEAADLRRVIRINLAAWGRTVPPLRALLPHPGHIEAVALSPDGRLALTGGAKSVRLWDVATGRLRPLRLAFPGEIMTASFSPDSKAFLVAGFDGAVQLWQTTGQPLGAPLRHRRLILAAVFSPDGQRVATASGDGTARVWETGTGRPLTPPLVHGRSVNSVAFSPDGGKVLTGGQDRTARLWDATTGAEQVRVAHPGPVRAVAFRPDGQAFLVGGDDGTARLWDAASGRPLGSALLHRDTVWAVAFSPDSRTALTASADGSSGLWNATSGRPLTPALRHSSGLCRASFSPDGRLVAIADSSPLVRLWEVMGGRPFGPPLRHRSSVRCVAFGADGTHLLTGDYDGTARLWRVPPVRAEVATLTHGEALHDLAFSPDGHSILTGGHDRTARLWDVLSQDTGEELACLPHPGPVRTVAFRPDGRALVVGGDNTARVWDAAGARPLGPPLRHPATVKKVSFSIGPRHGQTILTITTDNTVWLWEAPGDKPAHALRHNGDVLAAAFRPDGKVLLTGSADRVARLWDTATGQPLGEPLAHPGFVAAVAFSPNGQTFATSSPSGPDGGVRLWDSATRQPRRLTLAHPGIVRSLVFSPDGSWLLSAGTDRTARLWNVRTGQAVGRPLQHEHEVWDAAFDPSGQIILTGSRDGTARLWDAASGRPLGPPLVHQRIVQKVAFGPDGKVMATAALGPTAWLWKVPAPMEGDAERLSLWARTRTGMELDDHGAAVVLDGPAWEKYRRRLQELGGPSD